MGKRWGAALGGNWGYKGACIATHSLSLSTGRAGVWVEVRECCPRGKRGKVSSILCRDNS